MLWRDNFPIQRYGLVIILAQSLTPSLTYARNPAPPRPEAIGTERLDEYGKPVGTGIVGRLMRLERDVASRFGKYDGWVKMLTGAAVAIGIIGPVLWWLVGDKMADLFK